jgi:hypothetical protein
MGAVHVCMWCNDVFPLSCGTQRTLFTLLVLKDKST